MACNFPSRFVMKTLMGGLHFQFLVLAIRNFKPRTLPSVSMQVNCKEALPGAISWISTECFVRVFLTVENLEGHVLSLRSSIFKLNESVVKFKILFMFYNCVNWKFRRFTQYSEWHMEPVNWVHMLCEFFNYKNGSIDTILGRGMRGIWSQSDCILGYLKWFRSS